jgi:hypothetical protein
VGKTCSTHGEGRRFYRIFVLRLEGKRPREKPRHRWEDNTKMDLKEIGIDGGTGFSGIGKGSNGKLLLAR